MSYVGAYKGPELENAHNRIVIVYRRSSFNSYWGFVSLDITSEVDGELDARLLAGPFLCTCSLPEGARVARNGGSKVAKQFMWGSLQDMADYIAHVYTTLT